MVLLTHGDCSLLCVTYWGLATHTCVCEFSRLSVQQCRYQCRLIIILANGDKIVWNFVQHAMFFVMKLHLEHVVCKISAILFRPHFWCHGYCRNAELQYPTHMAKAVVMIFTHLPQCHIYASMNWASISLGNGLSPVRCQAITWTKAGLLSIGLLRTNFSQNSKPIFIISIPVNAKRVAILSKGRWVKWLVVTGHTFNNCKCGQYHESWNVGPTA